jgi:Ala-tRNA(Pro) deacylase
VIFEYSHSIEIKDLEQKLKQGKLSFASDKRLLKYLGLLPGSVSPFGLITDMSKNVHVFLDENLAKAEKISFHPNLNTASLVLSYHDFMRFLNHTNNLYEYIKLYD